MITDAKWYLGGENSYRIDNGNVTFYYNFERGTKVYDSNYPTNWVGKVGLIYPSDYIYTYSSGVDDKCLANIANCTVSNGATPSSGWI